jgi:carboxypeptidase family protein
MLRLPLATTQRAAWWLASLVLCVTGAHAQSGSIHGVVVDAETGRALPYSAVTMVASGLERFSDDSGRFVLAGLKPDRVVLRVRHIGYAPKETDVAVGQGQSVDLKVELRRIAITLAGIRVEAAKECVEPGPPRPEVDSALVVVFQQLEQNAQQYRLITTKYPFESTVHQYYSYNTTAGIAPIREALSIVRSDGREHYAPGDVVVQHGLARAVAIPSLAVFTDRAFIEAHCFRTGGLEEVEGQRLFRIDFQAAEKIDSPDLDGSIYLDPANFVIRRSVIRVSKLSRGLNEFDSITVTSQFEEIFPGVPIVAEADGLSHYAKPRASNGERLLAFAEHQRDVQVRFLRGVPRRNEDAGDRSSAVQPVRRLDRLLGVFDGENGEPIVGAAVTDSASGLTAKTTATGTVSLAFLASSRAVLQIRAQGYPDVRTELRLTFSDTIPVTMILHRVARPSVSVVFPDVWDAIGVGAVDATFSSLRRTRVRIVYTATSSAF